MPTPFTEGHHHRLPVVLDAADAGLIHLSPEVARLRSQAGRIAAALTDAPASTDGASEDELARLSAVALDSGSDLPDLEVAAEVVARHTATHVRRRALLQSRADIGRRLATALYAATSDVQSQLGERLGRLMSEARTALTTAGGLEVALDAPQRARAARIRLDELGAEYASLRDVWSALVGQDRAELDDRGRFVLFHDGQKLRRSFLEQPTPLPTGAALLAFIAERDLSPWFPTAYERDRRFAEVFPAASHVDNWQRKTGLRRTRGIGDDRIRGGRVVAS